MKESNRIKEWLHRKIAEEEKTDRYIGMSEKDFNPDGMTEASAVMRIMEKNFYGTPFELAPNPYEASGNQKLYVISGIVWDTDGEKIPELPVSTIVETDDEEGIVDFLSDTYGWCIETVDSIREL